MCCLKWPCYSYYAIQQYFVKHNKLWSLFQLLKITGKTHKYSKGTKLIVYARFKKAQKKRKEKHFWISTSKNANIQLSAMGAGFGA